MVATSVRSNRLKLEGARFLRVVIVPASETGTDAPYTDDERNLAALPLLTRRDADWPAAVHLDRRRSQNGAL
jgi:hypothetical protein